MPRTPVAAGDRIITRFARKRRNHWSPANIDGAVRVLNDVHQWLAERHLTLLDDDVEALADALDDYLAHRLELGRAPATVLVDHRQLAAFYKWATTDQGDGDRLIRRNPMRDVAPPRQVDPDSERMPVAQSWQYDALIATCRGRRTRDGARRALDRRDAAIIAMLWHTGMRRGECAAIDYERVDFDTQSVHLPKTKGGRAARSRNVAIVDEAMEYLDRYVDQRGTHDGPLWESTRGRRRLSADAISTMLDRRGALAAATLGLDAPVHAPSHSFRRASAIDWLDSGGSETTLMRNHGWRTNKMVDVYTAPSADELAANEARRVAEARRAGRLRVVS